MRTLLTILVILSISIAAYAGGSFDTMVFHRIAEPKENAFTMLIPQGWLVEGGIMRVDPISGGGAGNAIAAKLDFAVKSDSKGTVMAHWMPDMIYFDMTYSPAGQMGLYPPGSNYNGMTVWPLMAATDFLSQVGFPNLHPQATNVTVVENKRLDDVATNYQQRVHAYVPQMTFSYDAALLTVTYTENGVNYKEILFTVIENWGQMGAGMWGNKESFYLRTPVDEFDKWQPVFSLMQESVQLNVQWVAGEVQGQIKRGEIAAKTQAEINRIAKEISDHRTQTNAEIHNDMYLNLTDQEDYVNPYTNEIETGSNQWAHRWQNESGDIIYTNSEDYDPNTDINLNHSDFKRSQIRERRPK